MFNSARFNTAGARFNGLGMPPTAPGAPATINFTLAVAIAGSDGTRMNRSFTETGRRSINLARNLFGGSADVPIPAAWPIAGTQAVYLLASGDITLKTNDPASPADTIALRAGVPLVWNASANIYPLPFHADVTGLFCSCTAPAFLQGAILTV